MKRISAAFCLLAILFYLLAYYWISYLLYVWVSLLTVSAIVVMLSFQSGRHLPVQIQLHCLWYPLLPSQITILGHHILTEDSTASLATSILPSPTSPSHLSVSALSAHWETFNQWKNQRLRESDEAVEVSKESLKWYPLLETDLKDEDWPKLLIGPCYNPAYIPRQSDIDSSTFLIISYWIE